MLPCKQEEGRVERSGRVAAKGPPGTPACELGLRKGREAGAPRQPCSGRPAKFIHYVRTFKGLALGCGEDRCGRGREGAEGTPGEMLGRGEV